MSRPRASAQVTLPLRLPLQLLLRSRMLVFGSHPSHSESPHPHEAPRCHAADDNPHAGGEEWWRQDAPIVPTDGMVITSSCSLKAGTYHLPKGISIQADGVTVDMTGVVLLGTGDVSVLYTRIVHPPRFACGQMTL